MGMRNRRVDTYISRSAEFSRPVLNYLRDVVHDACPGVTETIKWGMPFFVQDGVLCHMAAFRHHCAFGLWKGARLVRPRAGGDAAMGQFGRIVTRADLPPRRTLVALLRKAARRNAAGTSAPGRATQARRPPPRPPADLRRALAADARALKTYRALPPSARREYVAWLQSAKRAETRARRLHQALIWLAAGKRHNWRYAG